MLNYHQVGATQALEALDQVGSYADLEEAIDSYFTNLGDTLDELGAGDAQVDDAFYGFAGVLKDRGIAYRPHGLGSWSCTTGT